MWPKQLTLPDLKVRGFSLHRESDDFPLGELLDRVPHGCKTYVKLKSAIDSTILRVFFIKEVYKTLENARKKPSKTAVL